MDIKSLEKGSAFFLIHPATSGLVAPLRDGMAYMASGKGPEPCSPIPVLSNGMECQVWPKSRPASPRGKTDHFCPLQMSH